MGIGKIRPQILNMPTEKKVEPFSVDFAYTRTVQEYVVPVTGLYKLEVWGAGNSESYGGGYSVGYKKLKKGQIIYVCVGQQGIYGYTAPDAYYTTNYMSGGYNGGGNASVGGSVNFPSRARSGCGATHMALQQAGKLTLAGIGKELFDQYGLIVAGGGSGLKWWESWELFDAGHSAGGGLTDSSRSTTQTTGYAFGQGATTAQGNGNGGGGGYYGGLNGNGGSGWIGGVPEIKYKGTTYSPTTTTGGNSGNGKATISFITK